MFDRSFLSEQGLTAAGLAAPPAPECVVLARRRVLRQLLEALLFENIVVAEETQQVDGTSFVLRGQGSDGEEVRYVARGRRRFSFGRIRLDGETILRVTSGGSREAESPTQLLQDTQCLHRADPERLAQFAAELEQTVIKHAQALQRGVVESCDDHYDQLESAVGAGHPYHPSFKSRVGFDLVDNACYGPEFAPQLQPVWLAAERQHTATAVSEDLDGDAFLQAELGAARWAEWRTRLLQTGRSPDDFVLLPVHPWQWREQIAPWFWEDLHEGRLIVLGSGHDFYRPQQSIRTLANLTQPLRASLKLSLSITNTSTSRILAPHTVRNAPLVSDWLGALVQSDPYLMRELRPIVLREVMGASFDPERTAPLQARTYGALSCIWRQSVHASLGPGESAAPWAVLTSLDRAGRPCVAPWLRRHGSAWLPRLLEVAVLPLLHLLVAHGVGLEAHAQNMILIHDGGWPTRVALKDFHDGVRFSPEHLAEPERVPRLHATPSRHVRVNRNSYLTTDRPAAVRDFLFDAFFFINLGEMALFFADHGIVDEPTFWELVARIVGGYERRSPGARDRMAAFELRPATFEVEKLANRRLFPETDVQTHQVRWPFAGNAEARAPLTGTTGADAAESA